MDIGVARLQNALREFRLVLSIRPHLGDKVKGSVLQRSQLSHGALVKVDRSDVVPAWQAFAILWDCPM